MNREKLIRIAKKMREKSYAPFSKYTVGASVETGDGTIIGGCNVESASYGLTCCAERIALYNTVSQGFSKFKAIAVASENGGFPCGACRQVLAEFCEELEIVLADSHGGRETVQLSELLPKRFGEEDLQSVPSSG